ncbi:MAG TPA: tetratricopeptide repeat protein [Trinickia sp.]|jgi:predicted negative regulator of RcsB-dependent stress response|uniref:YfgM family protein n=1 Tax=Trinickia sp. TaxID=2571163 RepID=UPI002CFC7F66|nr:tetratricopeptide repeat protein [Trinickia sp.]HTI16220.1 tetratricopeptide repeat protein [Trinickia sp.]
MSYHDEQESIESVKAWWAQWGNALTWVLLAALIAGAGWNAWHFWQRREAAQAAVLYEQVQQAASAKNKADVVRDASDMESRYDSTAYAQMTALVAAKALYDAGDTAGAKTQLQWAIDHAKDDEYKLIAKLRLAAVMLDEKSYDAGLALLSGTPPEGFKSAVADRRGDLLAAAGKREDAREAYRLALDSLAKNDTAGRQVIQFKLDALGS